MPGLKKYFPDVQMGANKATPDELDRYETYVVTYPSISATYVGTSAGGTASQAKAIVLSEIRTDFPRNLLYGVVGTNDFGGSWVLNGKDQFGASVTETVALATAAAGTPNASLVAGTACFSEISSGTFTATSDSVGLGSARVGVAVGTGATNKFWLGLPTKIGGTADVKTITWSAECVPTTVNGGTYSTSFINATNHAIGNDSIMAGTEVFTVTYVPTYDAQSDGNNIANR